MDDIRDVALLARKCRGFSQFDPALSFEDRRRLLEKRTTDELADAVMRRRRRALHSTLLEELDALAMNDSISPQRRGKEFEKWFAGVFEASQLRYTLDVRNEWEQIDFTLWLGSLFAIGAARWLKEPVLALYRSEAHPKGAMPRGVGFGGLRGAHNLKSRSNTSLVVIS